MHIVQHMYHLILSKSANSVELTTSLLLAAAFKATYIMPRKYSLLAYLVVDRAKSIGILTMLLQRIA